jgi:hypothetical protein
VNTLEEIYLKDTCSALPLALARSFSESSKFWSSEIKKSLFSLMSRDKIQQ